MEEKIMKLSQSALKKIIKEELDVFLSEKLTDKDKKKKKELEDELEKIEHK